MTGTLAGVMAVQLCDSGLFTTIANLGLGLATLLVLFLPQDSEARVDAPALSDSRRRVAPVRLGSGFNRSV